MSSASVAKPAASSAMGGRLLKVLRYWAKHRPVELTALTVLLPWLLRLLSSGIWRLLTSSSKDNIKYTIVRKATSDIETENVDDARLIKLRGKTFTQTESTEKADLSIFGALPYWLPVMTIGMEGTLLLTRGIEFLRSRGYSPDQRGRVQGYIFFAVLPVVDLIVGDDWANPSKEQQKGRRLAYRFRLPLYLWVLFEFITTVAVFRTILDFKNGLSVRSRWAMLIQLALLNGVFGINVSHELLHKNNKMEKAMAWALLTNVNYTHWNDEHEVGHHANVATPLDPATSREGETLYQFLPRTFIGSFKSSCKLEQARLLREEGITDWYTPKNRVLRGMLSSAVWAVALARISKNWWGIPLFYVQGAFAGLLLEVVNYIEHFGLQRRQDPVTGEYEPVDPRHSWNAPNRFSNTILFKLQRHSDHHTFPTRPYEILRNFEQSPQMPTGYIGMFVLAWFPPAFFWIMNPLLEGYRLEFNPDRDPTEDELRKAHELKLVARHRIWTWTIGCFAAPTAIIAYKNRRLIQRALAGGKA